MSANWINFPHTQLSLTNSPKQEPLCPTSPSPPLAGEVGGEPRFLLRAPNSYNSNLNQSPSYRSPEAEDGNGNASAQGSGHWSHAGGRAPHSVSPRVGGDLVRLSLRLEVGGSRLRGSALGAALHLVPRHSSVGWGRGWLCAALCGSGSPPARG